MFKFFKKHKLAYDLAMCVVAATASFLWWYDFFEADAKWRWLGGAFFGSMAILKVIDLIGALRKKKRLSQYTINGEQGRRNR